MIVCHICQADGVLRVNNKWFCTNHVAEGVVEALECAQATRISVGREPISVEEILAIQEEEP